MNQKCYCYFITPTDTTTTNNTDIYNNDNNECILIIIIESTGTEARSGHCQGAGQLGQFSTASLFPFVVNDIKFNLVGICASNFLIF